MWLSILASITLAIKWCNYTGQDTGQKFKITPHGFIFLKIIYIHTKKRDETFHNPAAGYIVC